ncbi:DUF4179 domain-containing protein [Niallia sp. 01092]|uniref:DUF4179 domain-containing protein n=1 Tax=unclassified Niallia TaxID=2837522 RepID=UPI003FD2152C
MEKKLLQKAYEEIEVPKEDVLYAIKAGTKRADAVMPKSSKKIKTIMWSTAAAAIIFAASSFISPSISHVMAEVPLLGNVYTAFNDAIGRSLHSQKLITSLNETASSKGIDVVMKESYYDGVVVGVTFEVKGDVKPTENGTVPGFYEIFGGQDWISDSKEWVHMEPSDHGYMGHIQLNYPYAVLPSNTTFPLEFTSIGGKEGSWKFDVPINQLPYETVQINKETALQKGDGEGKVHLNSIIFGKASTAINYTTAFPIERKNYDDVTLDVYNDQGEKLYTSISGDLDSSEINGQFIKKMRDIIPQGLIGAASYLDIHPKVAISEEAQFVKLNKKMPVELKAKRQNFVVKIEKILVEDNRCIVDIQVNNGDEKGWGFTNIKSNFVHGSVNLVKESEKDIYGMRYIKHTVKTIDKDNLRFRSTFDISNLDDFNKDNYILRVPISLNSSIVELENVKVDLN